MKNKIGRFLKSLFSKYRQYLYKTRKLSVILLIAVFLMFVMQIFNGIKSRDEFKAFSIVKADEIKKIDCHIRGFHEIRDVVISDQKEISEIFYFIRNGIRSNSPKGISSYSDVFTLRILTIKGRTFMIDLMKDEDIKEIQIIYCFYGGGYYFDIVDSTNLVERLILSK